MAESEEIESESEPSRSRHRREHAMDNDIKEDVGVRMSSNHRRGASGVVAMDDEADGTDTEETDKQNVTGSKSGRRCEGIRLKWSAEEVKLLRSEFHEFFKLKKPPDKDSIRLAVSRHAVLRRRIAPQVKSRTWYLMQKAGQNHLL